ncbi:hypothetical protein LCGC14_0442660 [marine sediment metagenome]|uniref:Uncharacterized protein n=1 Tax=marine sediment metagenome TaxID=412755 RepID=A0A0F9V702_9ZZZZ
MDTMTKTLQTETATITGMEEALLTFTSRDRNSPVCITCGTNQIKPEHFRDNKSRREFKISQTCQGCQDEADGSEVYI